MEKPACPMCEMKEVLNHPEKWECMTCGHEWEKEKAAEKEQEAATGPRIVKDAFGNVLSDGDSVALIKDLPMKGSSKVLKGGTKAKNIRLGDGDHEISCKIEGMSIGLKACFVKKA